MNQKNFWRPSKLLKRIRQLAYLGMHPLDHVRCSQALASSPLRSAKWSSFKYLGDHLALSLRTAERREALVRHHAIVCEYLSPGTAMQIQGGVEIWRRDLPGEPPLSLVLEPSKLAPMEGELQLRFSHGSDLQVLTFSFAPGHLFNSSCRKVLFVGGVQGLRGCREQIRSASKRNCEIAPAAVLVLGVQAIANQMGAEIFAVREADQVAMTHSAFMIRFSYEQFWSEFGGFQRDRFFSLPLKMIPRQLSTVAISHRSRTRKKREEKARIREQIETTFQRLLASHRAVRPVDAMPPVGQTEATSSPSTSVVHQQETSAASRMTERSGQQEAMF